MTPQPQTRVSKAGTTLHYWSREQLLVSWDSKHDLKLLANGCRLNALTAIQDAGSGHIGTSFSSLDIMVAARFFLDSEHFPHQTGDQRVFFSSKGHDAPALYATMHLCGELSDDDLFTLRRLGGLPGHPETSTPGVPTNTGSLGMGISKAKGFVKAQRLKNPDRRDPVIVILGDGELGEGQIWESMPGAVRDGFSELIAIVDANGIQSDTWTENTLPLGDLRRRVEGSGWSYVECDGNDPVAVLDAFHKASTLDSPTFITANTVKGSGVPWMEQFPENGEYYKFHSGALAPEIYQEAVRALSPQFEQTGAVASSLPADRPERDSYTPQARAESLLTLWEDMLIQMMETNQDVVALDGDLSYDTGTHRARHSFPARYIQAGIAEQDMVSMAGALALSGLTPFVHSFATFLTMRGTEQIFNNATEYTKIVYLGFLAGLVPSAPGFSHQAVTDVGIMSSIPGMRVFEPACSTELGGVLQAALDYDGPSYFRMGGLNPLPGVSPMTSPSALVSRREGENVAIVTSGPLLGQQALAAAELLEGLGIKAAVFTRPEITAALSDKDIEQLSAFPLVVVLENHNPSRGNHYHSNDALSSIAGVRVVRRGLEGVPANGQPQEVLKHHELDADSLAGEIQSLLQTL